MAALKNSYSHILLKLHHTWFDFLIQIAHISLKPEMYISCPHYIWLPYNGLLTMVLQAAPRLGYSSVNYILYSYLNIVSYLIKHICVTKKGF